MRKRIIAFLLVLAAFSPLYGFCQQQPAQAPSGAEVLTNELILKMVNAKIGEDIIISKIRTSPCRFDTSIDAILKLKEGGVGDAVIQAMVAAGARADAEAKEAAADEEAPPDPNDPTAPHEAGIYWRPKEKRDKQMVQLEPSVYSAGKSGGLFASAMTYGAVKSKWKAVVRSARANLRISESVPEFWFYFEQKTSGLSYSGTFIGGASSPNEFILAKMEKKSKERELVVAQAGFASYSVGTRSKDTVAFRFDKVAPGIYKVTPESPLRPGEYCFFYAGTSMAMGMAGGKLFDFGVDPAK